jgi:CO dehydrogenase/acetyl-CoA synthase beta subunit
MNKNGCIGNPWSLEFNLSENTQNRESVSNDSVNIWLRYSEIFKNRPRTRKDDNPVIEFIQLKNWQADETLKEFVQEANQAYRSQIDRMIQSHYHDVKSLFTYMKNISDLSHTLSPCIDTPVNEEKEKVLEKPVPNPKKQKRDDVGDDSIYEGES